MTMIPQMIRYASRMHHGQKRKKNGRPYFRDHCLGLLEDICNDRFLGDDEEAHLIILGHDIVEDCTLDDTDEQRAPLYEDIAETFGHEVELGIAELTNRFSKKRYPRMNRRTRKSYELKRLANISDRGKILKLYDRRANLRDMIEAKDFRIGYAQESWELGYTLSTAENSYIAVQVMALCAEIRDNA